MISTMPLISVLMNCHNGEKYLKESIQSILNQSYINFEIIFFDNLSTDNSASIFRDFKDKRLKYYKSDIKLTLSEARIEAWKYINGEYVAVLDTDDIAMPDRLFTQINQFTLDKTLSVLGGNCEIINETGNLVSNTDFDTNSSKLSNQLHYSFPFNNATLMFRKKSVDVIGGYQSEYTMINDYVLIYKLSKNYRVANIKNCISKNRIHSKNLTNTNHIINMIEQYIFLKSIKANIEEKYIIKNNIIYTSRYFIKIFMFYLFKVDLKNLLAHVKDIKIDYLIYFFLKVDKKN